MNNDYLAYFAPSSWYLLILCYLVPFKFLQFLYYLLKVESIGRRTCSKKFKLKKLADFFFCFTLHPDIITPLKNLEGATPGLYECTLGYYRLLWEHMSTFVNDANKSMRNRLLSNFRWEIDCMWMSPTHFPGFRDPLAASVDQTVHEKRNKRFFSSLQYIF